MAPIQDFKLERYFAEYEFKAPYLLSASDCESLSLKDLLGMADPKSLAAWEQLSLGYTESFGHPELREEISRLYPGLSSDQILIMAPEEGIFIAMNVLLSLGDEVIVVTPAYQSLHEIARSIGCRIIPWPLRPTGGRWQLDLAALPQMITPRTRMIVINFPNNPTGFLPGRELLNAVVDQARSHHLWLFSDEMYRLLEHDHSAQLPTVGSLYEMGISLSGMSKAFGLAGLRIGWLATQDAQVYGQFVRYKDYTTICSSAPSELLALMALRSKEAIIHRNLSIIRENLAVIQSFIDKNSQLLKWYQPSGGSIAFPAWMGSKNIKQFCRELVEGYGVMAVPGDMFDYDLPHLRIGLGRRNLDQALERTQIYLNRLS